MLQRWRAIHVLQCSNKEFSQRDRCARKQPPVGHGLLFVLDTVSISIVSPFSRWIGCTCNLSLVRWEVNFPRSSPASRASIFHVLCTNHPPLSLGPRTRASVTRSWPWLPIQPLACCWLLASPLFFPSTFSHPLVFLLGFIFAALVRVHRVGSASHARVPCAMGVIFDERKYPVVDSAPTVRRTGAWRAEAMPRRKRAAKKPWCGTKRPTNDGRSSDQAMRTMRRVRRRRVVD